MNVITGALLVGLFSLVAGGAVAAMHWKVDEGFTVLARDTLLAAGAVWLLVMAVFALLVGGSLLLSPVLS